MPLCEDCFTAMTRTRMSPPSCLQIKILLSGRAALPILFLILHTPPMLLFFPVLPAPPSLRGAALPGLFGFGSPHCPFSPRSLQSLPPFSSFRARQVTFLPCNEPVPPRVPARLPPATLRTASSPRRRIVLDPAVPLPPRWTLYL